MAETAVFSSFPDFRDACLDTTPPGSFAFHGQLYTHTHPGDEKIRQLLLDKGRPLGGLVAGEYLDFVERNIRRGVRLGRLIVVHGPSEPNHEPQRLAEATQIFEPIQARGETVRVAEYGRQILRLKQACGTDSELVYDYESGIDIRCSQASFWSIQVPDPESAGGLSLSKVWFMNYVPNGKLIGSAQHEPEFPDDVRRYEAFWRGVFESPVESVPLPRVLAGHL